MKKFLCYDTNDAASGKIDVDSRGVLKSTGSSAQADWNVMDSADPAFIKNKPFGEVLGVEIFNQFFSSSPGTDENGNQVFTFTSGDSLTIGLLSNIEINQKVYENIKANTEWNGSTTWIITFDTTGLPFTVVVNSGYETGTTVTVTSLDGSYISGIIIFDMTRTSQVKLKAKYIDTSTGANGLGTIFPFCGEGGTHRATDKMHLVYDATNAKFNITYDTYLKSSDSDKIFKITVNDAGTISATEV